ncbi:MAG: acetyltransferase [Oligoflexia bacterium]|nr:acetyltransferase [Oligoflexia bacterium]
MNNNILVLGCGSQSRYVIDIADYDNSINILGLIDVENGNSVNNIINGKKVIGKIRDVEKLFSPKEIKLVVAHGNNSLKQVLVKHFTDLNYLFSNVISPLATISKYALLSGEGIIICHNVTIQPNAKIGSHVIIHSNSVIEHDCTIGDYSNIAPSVTLAGYVSVGKKSYVYTGASIIPRILIGDESVVGAGSVVLQDVPNKTIVAGVPSKILKFVKDETLSVSIIEQK